MNKKKMIIISFIGIFLVLFILLGLTYAYFVTQIEGNGNNKSVEVSTANLKLVYGDGNGTITANNIMPGTIISTKIFTVKNEGNATVNNYAVYLEDVINTFTNTNDVTYTLECSSSDFNYCRGNEGTFPTTNDLILKNSIKVGVTHTYTLTVEYKETGVDQSIDMGSTLSAKVQIYDSKDIVDLTGIVSGYSEGDYVSIHSKEKTSVINNNGTYKLTAIEPGSHILCIKDKEGNMLGQKTIVIKKEKTSKIEGTIIKVDDTVQTALIDITSIPEELVVNISSLKTYNPFTEGTLAYEIYKNALLESNGTQYNDIPLTNIASNSSLFTSNRPFILNLSETYKTQYITYAEEYSNSGEKTILSNVKYCKYSEEECKKTLKGKYLLSNQPSCMFSANATIRSLSNSFGVLQVESAEENFIKYKAFNNDQITERELNINEDDYGNSYYFRGSIKDNYITFANKCWQILRINGDGSIKLALADNNEICSEIIDYTPGIGAISFSNIKESIMINGVSTQITKYDLKTSLVFSSLENYQNNIFITNPSIKDYIAPNYLCNETDAYYYNDLDNKINDFDKYYSKGKNLYFEPYKRNFLKKSPKLSCSGDKILKWDNNNEIYISTLTFDDLLFSGFGYDRWNSIYSYGSFLNNLKNIWTISPFMFQHDYNSDFVVSLSEYNVAYSMLSASKYVIPTINLKPGILISNGNGTLINPYIVE